MNIAFEKWHGAGNDFILIDNWKKNVDLSAKMIQKLCDRHFGIGADAVIFFESSEIADAKMNYFNAEGMPAETCGNGLRVVAAYGKQHGFFTESKLTIENPNERVDEISIIFENPWEVKINLGMPKTSGVSDFPDNFLGKTIAINSGDYQVWCVSVGNPHAVQFVENVNTAPVEKEGSELENHKLFPNRINVEFVEALSPTEANLRVWERGVGETLACGSAAAATVVAGTLAEKFIKNTEITLHLRGGDLKVFWDQEKNQVFKTGAAEFVFRGDIDV